MEGPCVQTDRGVLAPGMKADINVFQNCRRPDRTRRRWVY